MNRVLLNPFEALKLPDNLELYLESDNGRATCMAFNRHGNVLAVGLSDGHIALWDFDTRSSDKGPTHYVGGETMSDGEATPHYQVTAVAFRPPRIGEALIASFAAAAPPGSVPGGSMARQVTAGRNGVVTSEHGTGIIRVYESLSGKVISDIKFDMPIIHFVPHPTRPNVLVVLPANMYPLLVTISPGQYSVSKIVYVAPVAPDRIHTFYDESLAPAGVNEGSTGGGDADTICAATSTNTVTAAVLHQQNDPNAPEQPHVVPLQPSTSGSGRRTTRVVLDPYAIAFSRNGRQILRGGPDGLVQVFEFKAVKNVISDWSQAVRSSSFKVAGGASIRSMTLTKSRLLVNSADRSLRLFEMDALVPPQSLGKGDDVDVFVPAVKTTFTEAVNRSQAKCACFSRDGDFVLAGMLGADAHRIVVWRASDGHPETTLEGPSEGILDLLWHPVQPVIASIGAQYGGVYVWAKNFTENWSAFAPEFTELEANEEYSENEGEFDAKHPSSDERVKREREREEEKTIVDIEAPFCFSSSDEDEGVHGSSKHRPLFFLPAIPEAEPPFKYPTHTNDESKKTARQLMKKRERRDSGLETTGNDRQQQQGATGRTVRKEKRLRPEPSAQSAGERAQTTNVKPPSNVTATGQNWSAQIDAPVPCVGSLSNDNDIQPALRVSDDAESPGGEMNM